MQRGHTRSITGLYRVHTRIGETAVKPPNPKYVPKPYKQMDFPGQRVQADVKFVPSSCVVDEATGEKYYQYTAIDEYSRFSYIAAFKEHISYLSAQFLDQLVKAFKFPILCVQTDNGMEFTKRLCITEKRTQILFEARIQHYGIQHKLIRPYTPRHNGKVERSHRKDNEYFYAAHKFYSFDDFQKQLAVYNRGYNNFPIRPLNWKIPESYIQAFLKNGEVF